MTPQHSLRKQDLLLASRLARGQVLGAFAELGDRADVIAGRVETLRQWLSNPWVWATGGAGLLVLGVALRRTGAVHALRWGWLAWRLWRGAVPALVRYRNARLP
jgi:hypothetical protein